MYIYDVGPWGCGKKLEEGIYIQCWEYWGMEYERLESDVGNYQTKQVHGNDTRIYMQLIIFRVWRLRARYLTS